MKTIHEILTQIKTDAEADLPALIEAEGLTAFENFEIGQSRNEKELAFFIYQDVISYDYDMNRITLIYQLQLPGVSVEDAAKYTDVVFEWIKDYNLENIGMTLYETISIDTWPNANDRTTIIFFDVSISEELDSCD